MNSASFLEESIKEMSFGKRWRDEPFNVSVKPWDLLQFMLLSNSVLRLNFEIFLFEIFFIFKVNKLSIYESHPEYLFLPLGPLAPDALYPLGWLRLLINYFSETKTLYLFSPRDMKFESLLETWIISFDL